MLKSDISKKIVKSEEKPSRMKPVEKETKIAETINARYAVWKWKVGRYLSVSG